MTYQKVGVTASSSSGAGAVVAWLWNVFLPEHQMPPEVAAAVGGLLAPIIAYFVSWFPRA